MPGRRLSQRTISLIKRYLTDSLVDDESPPDDCDVITHLIDENKRHLDEKEEAYKVLLEAYKCLDEKTVVFRGGDSWSWNLQN